MSHIFFVGFVFEYVFQWHYIGHTILLVRLRAKIWHKIQGGLVNEYGSRYSLNANKVEGSGSRWTAIDVYPPSIRMLREVVLLNGRSGMQPAAQHHESTSFINIWPTSHCRQISWSPCSAILSLSPQPASRRAECAHRRFAHIRSHMSVKTQDDAHSPGERRAWSSLCGATRLAGGLGRWSRRPFFIQRPKPNWLATKNIQATVI
jgi:hypothetical protein